MIMRRIKVKDVRTYIRDFEELRSLLQTEARKQNTLLSDSFVEKMSNIDGAIEELKSQVEESYINIDFDRTYCSKFDID